MHLLHHEKEVFRVKMEALTEKKAMDQPIKTGIEKKGVLVLWLGMSIK